MKEITFGAFWSIAQELFGAALWPLVILAALIVLADLAGLVRARKVGRRVWTYAAGIGVVAGLGAALLAPALTGSSLAQVAAMTDWLMLLAIGLAVGLGVGLAVAGITVATTWLRRGRSA